MREKIKKEKTRTYYPFSFPVFCPVSEERMCFISKEEISVLVKNPTHFTGSYIYNYKDYLLQDLDFLTFNNKIPLLENIMSVIVLLYSLWHYTSNAEGETLPTALSSMELPLIVSACFFFIEELLPPGGTKNSQNIINPEESKNLVFNLAQKVYQLLRQVIIYPRTLHNTLSNYLKTLEKKQLAMVKETGRSLNNEPFYYLGRLIIQKQFRCK